MLRLVPVFLLIVFSFAASAFAATVERIDVVDAGTYRIETGDKTQEANTPTGEITAVDNSVLVEATDTIVASPGAEFGFRYVVIGEPAGGEVELDFVITYPATGLTDPATGTTLHESRYSAAKTIGKREYLGYGLESDWEAVPGEWRFEIWHDGRMLAKHAFTLTK